MGLGVLLLSISVFLVFALYFATKFWGSQENQAVEIHDTTGSIYYIGPMHNLSHNSNCIYVPNYPTTHPPAYCTPLKGAQGDNPVNFEPKTYPDLSKISASEANVKEKGYNPQRVQQTSCIDEEKLQGQGSASISILPPEITDATKTDCPGLRTLAKAHVKGANDNRSLSQMFGKSEGQQPDEQLPSYKQLSMNSQSTSHTRQSLKQDTAYLGRQRPDYRPPSTVRNLVDFHGSGNFHPTLSSHSPP